VPSPDPGPGDSSRDSALFATRVVPLESMVTGSIVMGLLFFPRGGAAQVTRYLAAALGDEGWSVSLVAGSLGAPGQGTHAPTFFTGIDLQYLDYTAAVAAFESGASALSAPVPMHPSYEDREGVPDAVLAAVDPALADHLASVWEVPFAAAGADRADLFHLHHLTSQHDTVTRLWPHVPLVAHLHGTEIKFMEAVEARAAVAGVLDLTLAAMPDAMDHAALDTGVLDGPQLDLLRSTRWSQWRHGEFWLARMRRRAAAADHLIAVSPSDRATAISVLGVPPERVTAVTNGVDTERFRPRRLGPEARRDCFRRWLVKDPKGWDESGVPGSVGYQEADLDRLLGPDGGTTVVMFVGRFTAAKRVSLLLHAFAHARSRCTASLLVWGGHPGEWEGEHPVTVASRIGLDGVFFAGWRGHHDLPQALAACDAVVMPSVNDSFPQTALEAMAVGRPVIATLSGGFPSMVNLDPDRPTGWLVAPDDVDALADALVEAVDHPGERARRGSAARAHAQANLSWAGRVPSFERVYATARERHRQGFGSRT
jgi:glycosyltransferase involved in cell wall biosynthesis